MTGGEDGAADAKTRLRTETELASQAEALEALWNVVHEAGIEGFLSGGTLLGAARDGDFIAWDWDVEVSVRSEDLDGRLDDVVERLAVAGFACREVDRSDDNLKVVVERDGTIVELQGYRRSGPWRTRREYRTEQRFFDRATDIELRGRTYRCMGPVDDYLTGRYGDWRTPRRTSDKSEYLNPTYFRRSRRRRRAQSLVRALIRRLRRPR